MSAHFLLKAKWLANLRSAVRSSSDKGTSDLEDESLSFDIPLPQSLGINTWTSEFLPACRSIGSLIHSDVEYIANIFAELEIRKEGEDVDNTLEADQDTNASTSITTVTPETLLEINRALDFDTYPPRRRRKRRRSLTFAEFEHPLVVHPASPSLPTIIITPCSFQAPEASCRVPLQDQDFGRRLTVPNYPAYNTAFPPMARPVLPPSDSVQWIWSGGHWKAVLPSLAEQDENGLFSRSVKRHQTRMQRTSL
ncbi:hypothetical protein BDN72DRAFT_953939 [Pluteus cervinus]|uniref:Uncharacterized protein n=1 Tax=Pluteus cervinus TaxID=181527 RepID=A0ACD3BI17_9AGAR|nr:hypothetical protein BDN72DRAFT_953939 [Pluteus cervinus]